MKKRVDHQNLLLELIILLSMIAITAIGMPTTTQQGERCQDICAVRDHENEDKFTADCSNRQHSTVPPVCDYVEELIFDSNPIHIIDVGMFSHFRNLAFLRMRDNGIYEIQSASFVNTALRDIDLSENHLRILEASALQNLSNLTQLNLKDNELKTIESYNLPNLTSLNLYNNQIRELNQKSFKQMTNLKYLDLYGNQISALEISFLGKLTNLETLILSKNRITSINGNAFVFLQNLEALQLDNNLISVSTLSNTKLFQNLKKLKILNLSNNSLSSLQSHMLFNVRGSLEYFSAANNTITFIEGRTFIGFAKLQHIDLTNNKLHANASEAFQTLTGQNSGAKNVEILLAENPICETYLNDFQDSYNITIFCGKNETKAYTDHQRTFVITHTPHKTERGNPIMHDILTKICLAAAGVLLVLIALLFVIARKYRSRRRNYARTMINMEYNYPLGRLPPTPPPPVPERGPSIRPPHEDNEGAYMNGTVGSCSTTSYIQPTCRCSSTNRGTCPHYLRPRDHRAPNHNLPPRPAKSSPDLRKIGDSSPDVNRTKSITVVGTNFGGSCRQMHVTGLPKVKKPWRRSISRHLPGLYMQRRETRDGRPIENKSNTTEEEEGAYMIREETEDGRLINSPLETNKSVPTDNSSKPQES